MSRNRKLGRGLEQLLNQSRKQAELEKQNNAGQGVSGETSSSNEGINTEDSGENMESVPSPSISAANSSAVFSGEKTERVLVDAEDDISDEEDDSEKKDSQFKFDLMREDLKQATMEMEALQKVVGESASSKSLSSGENQKTLMDYKNSESNDAVVTAKNDASPSFFSSSSTTRPVKNPSTAGIEKNNYSGEDDVDRIYNISVALVDSNPWQPREFFNPKDIADLAESIKQHGLLQPIVVRKAAGRYQLVAGERRFRAAMKLNWTQVPATIIDATDREMSELALIENLQRKDLNPIEKAASFNKYLIENRASQEELAKRLNLDRSTIANLVRLLALPEEIQQKIIQEKLTQGHARALLALNTTQDQIALAQRVENERLTVRQVEQMVSDWNNKTPDERRAGDITKESAPTSNTRKKETEPILLDLERQLRDALDLKVKITKSADGKGKLEIYFRNSNEFEGLMDYFRS